MSNKDNEDRLNKLLGKTDNDELNKILGKKSKGKIEPKKHKIKCPKCGHSFEEDE
jgi:hypothetical protein